MEDNVKLSLICVYNDKKAFESMLLKSLNRQNICFELIALDNTNNKFSSAAEALNYGASIAKTDTLIFSHQDIFLKSQSSLEEFYNSINSSPVGTIIGTQGVKENSHIYYSNITAGNKLVSEYLNDYPLELIEVSCFDEGFFGMKKETWNLHHFDQEKCDNWHLYAVESALWFRKHGYKVYVFPIQLHHFSYGNISLGYMRNLKLLCNIYRNDFKYIWTTCYKVRTNWFYINTLFFVWSINRIMRGKYK